MAKLDITSRERSTLRAAAHPLRPVVLIGDKGLSESVLKEIDLNLTAHELIKVRVAGEDRTTREQLLQSMCDALGCAPVHHLGNTLVLFRPKSTQTDEAEFETRALRKGSEPYTPKKLAAQGMIRTRHGRNVRPASRPATASAARPTAVSRPSPDSASGLHNIPRRSKGSAKGSALTLRPGGRRNTARRQK